MSVTRVGATKRYSDNWDNIFGSRGRASATKKKPATVKPARQSAKKQSAAKSGRKPLKKKASRRK